MQSVLNFIFLVTICFTLINCNKKTKSNKIESNWGFNKNDTITKLNLAFNDFYIVAQKNDSLKQNLQFDSCYNLLDIIASDSNYNNSNIVSYYSNFNNLLDNCIKTNPLQKNFLKYKTKILLYSIFINDKFEKHENVIKFYKELSSISLKPFLADSNKIKRMRDVGIAYNKIGDLTQTEKIYLETIKLAREIKNDDDLGMAIVNYNELLKNKQQYDTIINLSKEITKKSIDQEVKANLLADIAFSYLKKSQIQLAEKNIADALQTLFNISESLKSPNYEMLLMYCYETLAKIAFEKKDINNTSNNYIKALNCFSQPTTNPNRYFAKLSIEAGKFKNQNPTSTLPFSPIAYYNKALLALQPNINFADSLALPDTTKLEAENVYFEALDAKANYLLPNALAQNNIPMLQKILQYYIISFKVEKMLLNNFVYDNAKISFIEESNLRTKNALQVCSILYNSTKKYDYLNTAFKLIENNKATVLLQRLKENSFLQNTFASDSLVSELHFAKRKKQDLVENNESEIEIKTIAEKIEQIDNQLKEKYPQLKNSFNFNNNNNITDAQNFLNNNTAMVDYLLTDSILYTIVIEKEKVSFTSNYLSKTELQEYTIQCANLEFQQTNPKLFLQNSYNLYNKIFPKNISTNINELVIIPNAEINALNFETLINKPATNFSNKNFLVNNYAFAYCYSFASLLQKNIFNDKANTILIATPASLSKLNNQEILPYSLNEAKSIINVFKNAKYLNSNNATKFNFLNAYNNYNILHIATHATADSVNGNSKIEFYDGVISANVFNESNIIKPNLVFLSACETSLGKLTNSEGVLSLARSMYYAGAQNVIASQWKVNDAATAKVVQSFYKNIKKEKYALSLQKSKLEYINNVSDDKKLPYYWASFIHIGYQKQYFTNNYNWIITIVGLFAIVGLLFWFKNKKPTSIFTK